MQSFVGAAGSEDNAKKAAELLDEAISGLVDYGVVMDEITTNDLLDTLSKMRQICNSKCLFKFNLFKMFLERK